MGFRFLACLCGKINHISSEAPMEPFWVRPVENLLDDMFVASNPMVCIERLMGFMRGFGLLPQHDHDHEHAVMTAATLRARDHLKLSRHKELFTIALLSDSCDCCRDEEKSDRIRISEECTRWLIRHARLFNPLVMEHYFMTSAENALENARVLVTCLTKFHGPWQERTVDWFAYNTGWTVLFQALQSLPWQSLSTPCAQVMMTSISWMDLDVIEDSVVKLLETNLPLGFACVAQAQKINWTCREITDKLRAALDFAIGDAFIMATVISTGAWQVPELWPLSDGRSLLHILEPVLICDPCDFSPQVAASPIAAALQRWSAPRRAWMAAVTRITSRDSAAASATAAPAAAPACKMQRSLQST